MWLIAERAGEFRSATVRFSLGVLFIAKALAASTSAAIVVFTATDLADITPGEDLWQYAYSPTGFSFAANEGFTVFFERTLFSQIQSPPPSVSDWEILTVQRDLVLNSNGFYDALALRSAPSLANPFTVQAVWLGTGGPGAQSFTVYDANFQPRAQGQTTNAIPEPGAFVLLLAGGITAFCRRAKRSFGFP